MGDTLFVGSREDAVALLRGLSRGSEKLRELDPCVHVEVDPEALNGSPRKMSAMCDGRVVHYTWGEDISPISGGGGS